MLNNDKLLENLLSKEIWRNEAIGSVINSTICEYDIKGAHLVAIRIIYGDKLYNELSLLPKDSRNIHIGKMIKNDQSLVKKLQDLLILFKKQFIMENDIMVSNIVETTKDSLVLAQKIPSKTIINVKGVDVEFRNKDGSYTSFYRIGNKSILYDSLIGNLRIKGINASTVQESPFIKKYFMELLNGLESNISLGSIECFKLMQEMRNKYINSTNMEIYRSLNDKNKFIYQIGSDFIETDVEIPNPGATLMKIINYKDFVMPLMKCIL